MKKYIVTIMVFILLIVAIELINSKTDYSPTIYGMETNNQLIEGGGSDG